MPEQDKHYYCYMMASLGRVLYCGVTGNLRGRVLRHKKQSASASFTTRYRCNRLVWYAHFYWAQNAITRETQIKGWKRERKIELIQAKNPTWADLAEDWFTTDQIAGIVRGYEGKPL